MSCNNKSISFKDISGLSYYNLDKLEVNECKNASRRSSDVWSDRLQRRRDGLSDEAEVRSSWRKNNNLDLNVSKTEEAAVEKQRIHYAPVRICWTWWRK